MTQRIEAVAEVDYLQTHAVALARNWFESQAAQFRLAQALVVGVRGDVDAIRERMDLLDEESKRAVHLKAIDALDKTRDLRKFSKLVPGTDIYRHHIRNAAITLLGQRALTATEQADRHEREYLAAE